MELLDELVLHPLEIRAGTLELCTDIRRQRKGGSEASSSQGEELRRSDRGFPTWPNLTGVRQCKSKPSTGDFRSLPPANRPLPAPGAPAPLLQTPELQPAFERSLTVVGQKRRVI